MLKCSFEKGMTLSRTLSKEGGRDRVSEKIGSTEEKETITLEDSFQMSSNMMQWIVASHQFEETTV